MTFQKLKKIYFLQKFLIAMQSLLTFYVNIFKRYAAKFASRWYDWHS